LAVRALPAIITAPGLVAQSVEQRIENPCVGGSIPPRPLNDDVATIQDKLSSFYLEALSTLRLSEDFQADQIEMLSAPFLLNLDAAKAYFEARIRVMFIGQETKGWVCRLPEVLNDPTNRVPTLLARYEKGLLADPGHSHFLRTRLLLERELTEGIPGSIILEQFIQNGRVQGKRKVKKRQEPLGSVNGVFSQTLPLRARIASARCYHFRLQRNPRRRRQVTFRGPEASDSACSRTERALALYVRSD
jgi:hypothetical protein